MVMTQCDKPTFQDQPRSCGMVWTCCGLARFALVAVVALCAFRCQAQVLPTPPEVQDAAEQVELPLVGGLESPVDTHVGEGITEVEAGEDTDSSIAKMCKNAGEVQLDCGLSATAIDVVLPYDPTSVVGQKQVCLKITGMGSPVYKLTLGEKVGCENVSKPQWQVFAFAGCVEGVKTGKEYEICVRATTSGPLVAPINCKTHYMVGAIIDGASCGGQFWVSAHYP